MDFHAGFRETGAVEPGAYCHRKRALRHRNQRYLDYLRVPCRGIYRRSLDYPLLRALLAGGGALFCAQYTSLCPYRSKESIMLSYSDRYHMLAIIVKERNPLIR
jgi:hypothetical protein